MKMKFISLLLAFSIGGWLNISAQSNPENSLLWEVTGKNLKKPSYLFGTFHLLCESDLGIANGAAEKLKSCDQLALELDFDDPNMMIEMQTLAGMKDGKMLEDLLGATKFKLADSLFTATTGISLKLLSGLKPMVASSVLYPSVLGCNPGSPETTLSALAGEAKKEVIGLEKVSDQMEVFDKIPYQVQADMLYSYITETDKFKKETDEMLAVYRSANLVEMQKMMADPEYGLDKYLDLLLTNRNKNWVKQMQTIMPEKATLFAVGAGHLGGNEGVISLLRKAGYTVKPL
jgi:uncharacterized protein YbaP (TraB family)